MPLLRNRDPDVVSDRMGTAPSDRPPPWVDRVGIKAAGVCWENGFQEEEVIELLGETAGTASNTNASEKSGRINPVRM